MSCSCIYTCSFYENKLRWYLKSIFARLHANPYLHQCKFPRRKATSPRFYPAADKMERVAEIPYAAGTRVLFYYGLCTLFICPNEELLRMHCHDEPLSHPLPAICYHPLSNQRMTEWRRLSIFMISWSSWNWFESCFCKKLGLISS